MLDYGEMQYMYRAGVWFDETLHLTQTTDTMPALLPRGARALRTGDDSGGRGYLIWQFGKVFSGCRIWSGTGTDPFLGAVLVPGLRVFCWPARPPVCDWLSRM